MPKPVLSDSLFNADDVATAILENAELSVTNQDFAVTDISSDIVRTSNWNDTSPTTKAFKFNGFVFCQLVMWRSGNATSGEIIANIQTASNRPAYDAVTVLYSYQGDDGEYLKINTSGEISVNGVTNAGDTYYRVNVNMFYRT